MIAFHVVLEETGMLEHFSTDFARDFVGAVDAPLVLPHLLLFHRLAALVANLPLSDDPESLESVQVKMHLDFGPKPRCQRNSAFWQNSGISDTFKKLEFSNR